MFKRFNAVMLTGLMLISSFTGCSKKEAIDQSSSDQVQIRVAFWGAVEEKGIITKTVQDWEAKNPNIDVILQHIPAGSYTDKVLTEIAGGNPPDIIFSDVDIFVTFFYKDALLDLTPYLKNDKDFHIEDYFPEVVARFTRDGKIFCIPRDTAPFGVIFYNKDIFDKLGIKYPSDNWNVNEFLEIAKKLTLDENDKTPYEKDFNYKKTKRYGFWGWSIHNFIYSYGGKIVDNVENPKKCLMNEQPVIDAMQFFIDLSFKHHVSPMPGVLVNMGMSINQLFAMEKLAMFQSGIWETPNLLRTVGNRFDWDIVMFPKGPTGKRGMGTGGSGYAIMKATKYPQEAWEVVKCLSGDWGQQMLADSGLAQPANKKIANGPYWVGNASPPANKKMLNEAVKYVTYNPFHPKWREVWDRYGYPQIDLILSKRVTVKEGLDSIVEKITPILQGTKELN